MSNDNKLIILGSTGSIGKSTLEVIKKNNQNFEVVCLTADSSSVALAEQINSFKPRYAFLNNSLLIDDLKSRLTHNQTTVIHDINQLQDILKSDLYDTLVSAMSGSTGLLLTYLALQSNKKVLLANKESLVMAGDLLSKYRKQIIPIDSEHNAIFQVIGNLDSKEINNITLTASGGPFRVYPKSKFDQITVEMALKHPNWSMGRKITIDSATMMNKCLEIIEAYYLFNLKSDQIDVLVHPESIIHSIVNYNDGSSLCQFSKPNMQIPISYALGYPNRINSGIDTFDLSSIEKLNFSKVDHDKFPSINYAYMALDGSEKSCLVLNAANELAVNAFLERQISFLSIFSIIEDSFSISLNSNGSSINEILDADMMCRQKIKQIIKKYLIN
ncbi:1-deoxy-D-xylulose 5-phosphate reductoisomerase [beta proteobacterium KB13]|uniref:1-deoxy-D-xylulose 5-phosphate reductoisomerase n=1 Tax=beta proteobacterium KB13 TaxID=314607 RepID=B6BTV5_9PROT|nr:1-deoxy-D-xylulose 5-phosphate reductoisomerase [beta proteobacterium KB13]